MLSELTLCQRPTAAAQTGNSGGPKQPMVVSKSHRPVELCDEAVAFIDRLKSGNLSKEDSLWWKRMKHKFTDVKEGDRLDLDVENASQRISTQRSAKS